MNELNYPTIHYTELAPMQPGCEQYLEWETYRREVGRLLAEGKEGQHVLIKGEQIIGFWPTREEALGAGYERFGRRRFLIHQIQERQRLYRNGYNAILSITYKAQSGHFVRNA